MSNKTHKKADKKKKYDDEKLIDKLKTYNYSIVYAIVLVVIGFIFLHDLFGGTLFSHNAWDSYAIQAKAWLDGKVSLGQNYPWLELAVYKDDYFVSFPPFPSVLMLPWVIIYGLNAPNNLIMIMYVIVAIVLAYKIIRFFNYKEEEASFLAVVVVLGCNMLWMATMGGVWFQAQLVNMILCLGALLCMLNDRRKLSYFLIACAVGCRPFSALYFIVLFVWYYLKDKKEAKDDKESFVKIIIKGQGKSFIAPLVVAIVYMWYNYVRFDSPFEFGHNYLPEFTESQYGQFNIVYLWDNLKNLIFRGITIDKAFKIDIPRFNGFLFYIANPLFLVAMIYIVINIKNKSFDLIRIILASLTVVNLLCLCMHKTLGGWQFGARYTVDMIPYALLYIMLSKNNKRLKRWEYFLGIFAIMFNLYGAIYIGNG
ncbi:MAG: hypothetical protein K6G26_07340 [Lachnospiraceae bacterium]|nr:hypothetical protein [Lachnospiraceae bacterium]